MFAWEDWSVREHLCQDTANTPDVDGLGVALQRGSMMYPDNWCHLGVQHDLRGPVPPGGHVLRQEACVVMLGVLQVRGVSDGPGDAEATHRHPGKTEVTNLQVTGGVQQQVAWFQVSVRTRKEEKSRRKLSRSQCKAGVK